MRMIMVAAAAAFVAAAPAAAQEATTGTTFTGPRAGVNVGFADEDVLGTEAFTYGVEVGYDLEVEGAVVGISAELQDSKDTGRDIAIVGRLGAKASPNILVYGLAGYTNLKIVDGFKLDGFRVGLGAEVAVTENVFGKVEQRYSNYPRLDGDFDGFQTVVGVGFRF